MKSSKLSERPKSAGPKVAYVNVTRESVQVNTRNGVQETCLAEDVPDNMNMPDDEKLWQKYHEATLSGNQSLDCSSFNETQASRPEMQRRTPSGSITRDVSNVTITDGSQGRISSSEFEPRGGAAMPLSAACSVNRPTSSVVQNKYPSRPRSAWRRPSSSPGNVGYRLARPALEVRQLVPDTTLRYCVKQFATFIYSLHF